MAEFDWDHLRTFIAVARCGRLTVAATRIGSDHTTVSRRITSLEQALRTTLFERSPSGYALTEQGERLLSIADQIETLAILAVDSVGGSSLATEGPVRIAGPEGFGSYFLAPRLCKLSQSHPGLNIQLLAGPSIYSLSKREADIVISLSRPPEGRLVARKLTDYDLGLYGARSYLANAPPILSKADLAGHRFVGYIGDLIQMPELDYFQQVSAGAVTNLESSNLLVQVKATAAGAGLCVLPTFIARFEPELVAILPQDIHLSRSFWLTIHADHKDRARVRIASRFIVDEVKEAKALFKLTPAAAPLRAADAPAGNGEPNIFMFPQPGR